MDDSTPTGPNPSGLCQCGCGGKTRLAKQTVRQRDWVQGQPIRFIMGHQNRKPGNYWTEHVPPNPSGLCMCGCGQETPIVNQNYRHLGLRKGEHHRYLQGHQGHKSPVPYIVDEDTGCWIWQRAINGKYGELWPDGSRGQKWSAHRWYYAQKYGPIPEGQVVHHKCRNRLCVNPDHLEAVTPEDHVERRAYRLRTHCKHGHEFTLKNTYRLPSGARKCKTCRALEQIRHWQRELDKLT